MPTHDSPSLAEAYARYHVLQSKTGEDGLTEAETHELVALATQVAEQRRVVYAPALRRLADAIRALEPPACERRVA
jgi:hypothetical protein